MIAFQMNSLCGVRLTWIHLCGIAVAVAMSPSASAQTSQPSIQEQVLTNLRQSPVGDHTLDALNLPDDYLRRVGDRILRNSYEQQFRVIVPDGSSATAPSSIEPPPVEGLENIAIPSNTIWPTLVSIAIAVCSFAAIILVIQAVRAKR
jgi:hypothetical protein